VDDNDWNHARHMLGGDILQIASRNNSKEFLNVLRELFAALGYFPVEIP